MNRPELEEAAGLAPLVDPDRIRLARELNGLTQAKLVERAGNAFTTAALSQLERGRTRPTPATLLAVSKATGCPVEFFIARPRDERHEGFFRSLQTTSPRERRKQLARARLLHEFVVALEEHVRLPEVNIPRFEVSDMERIERVAERTREAWGVEPGPIDNMVRLLERHGVVVVRLANFQREIDAFSVDHSGHPIVVLGTEKAVTTRSRFDAAHELGHLIMHSDEDAGTREAENQAHRFAAALLMPASEIRPELPEKADWPKLMQLKKRWRASLAALLLRARDLGVMSTHQYVNAMKTMSVRGWRKQEPGDDQLGPLESPVLLRRAIGHLADSDVTVEEVCAAAGLPIYEIQRLIELAQDPRPRVRI